MSASLRRPIAPRRAIDVLWRAVVVLLPVLALTATAIARSAGVPGRMPPPEQDAASGLFGFRAPTGAWQISPQFSSAEPFSGGLAFVERPDRGAGLIDLRGAMVTPNVVPAIWSGGPTLTVARASEGLLAARDVQSNTVGFVDARGRWVIRPRFADAFEFREGLAAVRLTDGGKVGFIDRLGRLVIPARFGTRFREPPVFAEGLAAVGVDDDWPRTNLDPPGRLGYIDRRGRWVIPPQFANGTSFEGGRATVVLRAAASEPSREISHPLRLTVKREPTLTR